MDVKTELAAQSLKRRQALGDAIARRLADLGWTQQDLADEMRVSLRTVNPLITGKSLNPSRNTRYGVERALGWTDGSVSEILAGGQPTLGDRAVTDVARGQVVDHETFIYRNLGNLPPADLAEVRRNGLVMDEVKTELAAQAAYEFFMTDVATGRTQHRWSDLSDESQTLWRRLVARAKLAAGW